MDGTLCCGDDVREDIADSLELVDIAETGVDALLRSFFFGARRRTRSRSALSAISLSVKFDNSWQTGWTGLDA